MNLSTTVLSTEFAQEIVHFFTTPIKFHFVDLLIGFGCVHLVYAISILLIRMYQQNKETSANF
jgi:hypothetical protein